MRNLQAPAGRPETGWAARRTLWRARLTPLVAGVAALLLVSCEGARTILVPVVYVVAGRVADPTQSPIAGVPGARVVVETAAQVAAVTSDAEGNFILQGVPPGTHRLRAELAGRVTTITYDFPVGANVANAFVPLFTPAQVDSVLAARGAPAWDRDLGLFGLFALKSTGVPLGDAAATFVPGPGGTLVQTGEGADPIVVVNAQPGAYALAVARSGYVWDGPYGLALRPGVLTFAAPRARPNFNGFLFADLPGGAPVAGAGVTALRGPSAGTATTTNFLGQFSLVGLARGTYVGRCVAAGFLPTLSFPQPLDQDTTLAVVAVSADSLAAWSAAAGVPAPDPAFGTLVLDVRDATTGATILGATAEMVSGEGTAAAQSARAPALRVRVPPGLQRVLARAPGYADAAIVDSVEVRAGEVTFGRFDLAAAAARTAQRR